MNYSLIVPIHNEQGSVDRLTHALVRVMDTITADYEIIFVDDASTDKSAENLKLVEGKNLKIVRFRERKGMASALQAGFDIARGKVFITLDGDYQNDPEDIPKLLSKLSEGYDLVCGWRKNRKDPLSKKIASQFANSVRRIVTGETVHDVGCTLRVFKREVVKNFRLSGGLHRYFTTLAAREGCRITEVPVNHFPRTSDKSKFGVWGRLVQGSGDLLLLKFKNAKGLVNDP